ncbi:hypothetical protein SEA_TOMAS_159 [Streptomyces phage Tomas]|uniref:Uncharacterized protein n=1 Tax=Streptomyces phage Tomas TaxID=2914443 RepID=A0AA49BT28_9CAUD|nr:hypothetical protein PP453_gp142 [Streptomyces phage Tomas]UMO76325.1 hypothetical protein SEA_TOMAS_159 [Streptomyces phage Tomas]
MAEEEETPAEKGLRERMKEDFKAYSRAKGIQAYEAAKTYLSNKSKAEKKGTYKPKSKKISALNPRDLTPKGEVLQIGRSPVDRRAHEITFLTDKGTVVTSMSSNEKIDVIGKGEVQ